MSNQRENPLRGGAGVCELFYTYGWCRGVLAGWASTPRLGVRRCVAVAPCSKSPNRMRPG